MMVIEKRQTAENLKEEILSTLLSYGIALWQIYSITVDNGANMLKTVRLLKLLQEDVFGRASSDTDEEETDVEITPTIDSLDADVVNLESYVNNF